MGPRTGPLDLVGLPCLRPRRLAKQLSSLNATPLRGTASQCHNLLWAKSLAAKPLHNYAATRCKRWRCAQLQRRLNEKLSLESTYVPKGVRRWG